MTEIPNHDHVKNPKDAAEVAVVVAVAGGIGIGSERILKEVARENLDLAKEEKEEKEKKEKEEKDEKDEEDEEVVDEEGEEIDVEEMEGTEEEVDSEVELEDVAEGVVKEPV